MVAVSTSAESGGDGRAAPSNVVALRPGDEPFGDWRDRLLYDVQGKQRRIERATANAITILRNDALWNGVLAWDDFSQGIVTRQPAPWGVDEQVPDDPQGRPGAWRETHAVRVQAWLARRYSLHLSPRECYSAALVVAEARPMNPIVDWLNGLAWDGTPRVAAWLSTYLAAAPTPYVRFVGQAFLVSAVARARAPGSKVDTMIVLEGEQGKGKSRALCLLFSPPWFSDTPLDMASKDRFLSLRGYWCHEVAELDSFGRADAARIKAYLSSPHDDFRPPYAATTVRVPRRIVFAGTVNPAALGYLRDETGNRRIWPVACGVLGRGIQLDALARDREQLWAEADVIYRGGAKWWPETEAERVLCNAEQAERVAVDVWAGVIAEWLDGRKPGARVSIREILTDALKIELAKQDRAAQSRAGQCVSLAEWLAAGRVSGGKRERLYGRREEVEPELRDAATAAGEDVERDAIIAENGGAPA